ncbi:MAG: hypothetical protein ONB15_00035 [candidate division KSB1 bacterium]|nr:hypothetical protein [candidate division KSB1 bacterium]
MLKRITLLAGVVLAVGQVMAQGIELSVGLNAVPNTEVKVSLVRHRFADRISGIVSDSDGLNFGTWQAGPNSRLLILTLKVEKPAGRRLQLFGNDFSLCYPHVEKEGWDDRSRATALRVLGRTPDENSELWLINASGYAGRQDPELDEAAVVYIEVGFHIEKGVRKAALQLARPVVALQLTSPVELGSALR